MQKSGFGITGQGQVLSAQPSPSASLYTNLKSTQKALSSSKPKLVFKSVKASPQNISQMIVPKEKLKVPFKSKM